MTQTTEKQQIEVVKQWIMEEFFQGKQKEMIYEEIHTLALEKGEQAEYFDFFNKEYVPAYVTFSALNDLIKEEKVYKLVKDEFRTDSLYAITPFSESVSMFVDESNTGKTTEQQQIEIVKQWIMEEFFHATQKESSYEDIHTFVFDKGEQKENKELFNHKHVHAMVTLYALLALLKENRLFKLQKGMDRPDSLYSTTPFPEPVSEQQEQPKEELIFTPTTNESDSILSKKDKINIVKQWILEYKISGYDFLDFYHKIDAIFQSKKEDDNFELSHLERIHSVTLFDALQELKEEKKMRTEERFHEGTVWNFYHLV